MKINSFIKKYGLSKTDMWDCHGNWILTHDAVTKIGHKEKIVLDSIESVYQSETSCRFLVTMSKGDAKITSVGEASKTNSKNVYFACMAEKRGIDRCILKLINAYEYGVYSVVEADDFEIKDDMGYTKEVEEDILSQQASDELKAEIDDEEHPLADAVKQTMSGIKVEDTKTDNDTIAFGKNKGMRWADVDEGYLDWVSKNLDRYKDKALAELEKRNPQPVAEEKIPF